MNWKYEGPFLDQFEDSNFISQRVIAAYRGLPPPYIMSPPEDRRPARNVTEMFKRMERDIDERLARKHEAHKADLAKLLEVLGDEETIRYCRFIAKRESLPYAEKEQAKRQESQQYVNAALQKRPPTVKQLQYLSSLGCAVRPSNQHEASVLIEQWKGRR